MATLYSTLSVVPKQWCIQGRGPWAPLPPYFKAKLRFEGPKKFGLETAPPPLSKGLDDRTLPPPPLSKVWILPKSTYKFSRLISIHFFEKLVETI